LARQAAQCQQAALEWAEVRRAVSVPFVWSGFVESRAFRPDNRHVPVRSPVQSPKREGSRPRSGSVRRCFLAGFAGAPLGRRGRPKNPSLVAAGDVPKNMLWRLCCRWMNRHRRSGLWD
jgi:hypothetical protein